MIPPTADLCMTRPAKGHVRTEQEPFDLHLGLYWRATRPSEITISISDGREQKIWSVGRAVFIAADLEHQRGAWVGGGLFGICYANVSAMMHFQSDHGPDAQRMVLITDLDPVREFILHSMRLCPPGPPESDANLRQVDRFLQTVFR